MKNSSTSFIATMIMIEDRISEGSSANSDQFPLRRIFLNNAFLSTFLWLQKRPIQQRSMKGEWRIDSFFPQPNRSHSS